MEYKRQQTFANYWLFHSISFNEIKKKRKFKKTFFFREKWLFISLYLQASYFNLSVKKSVVRFQASSAAALS